MIKAAVPQAQRASAARFPRRAPPLHAPPLVQRKAGCACGGSCPRCKESAIQPKLRVSEPSDALEREADTVADQVMRMPASAGPSLAAPAANNVSASDLSANLGSGAPLDAGTRGFFESRFGAKFGHVRVHTGEPASQLADAYQARAFTYGNHIVFNRGEYAPHTASGKHLMAHELAHVRQQARMPGIARRIQRACDARTTRVADPQAAIDNARATALSAVQGALAAFKPMKSKTLTLLDRHFHCPTVSQMIQVKNVLARIESEIPSLPVNCFPVSDANCADGGSGNARDGRSELNVCPPWFSRKTDIERAVTFIFAAAAGVGRTQRCRRVEPCYDDYMQTASSMLQNPYSFAWFAVEAAGLSPPDNSIVPCRPQGTGVHYIVPPDAATDPTKIRRLSGFETIPEGSRFAELMSDSSGKYFIYDDTIEGAKQYLPDEPRRYYFPNGRP